MTQANIDLTLEIYEGFARNELHRWDAVIHPDVKLNSPAGRDIVGIDALKTFAAAFHAAFRPRIDLIDHFVAGDRAMVTVNLHWQHNGEQFYGVAATGRSGTSVESFLLRLENGQVTHWETADQSLDLALYLHDHGFDMPRGVTPPALVEGRSS